MNGKHNRRLILTLFPLFLVLFVDSFGMAFIMPLFSPLFLQTHSPFFSIATSIDWRNFYYGLSLAIFPIAAFFGAPILGSFSDQVGRKKTLIICLLGSLLGYLLSGLSVGFHHFYLLLVGRLIDGFTAGSLSIAQAAIVDISTEEHKSANLALILFAAALGLLLGPLLSSVLSKITIFHLNSLALPFYFAAMIAFLNLLVLWGLFSETAKELKTVTVEWFLGLKSFMHAFINADIRHLSMVFLFMQFGWAIFFQFVAVYLVESFQFNTLQIGLYMALIGVGITISFCFLIRHLTALFLLTQLVIGSIALMAICLIILFAGNAFVAWFIPLPMAILFGIAYSAQITLFSNQVASDKQGWIMGITGAISFFSFGISGILASLLVDLSPAIPLFVSAICFMFGAFFAWRKARFILVN